MPSTHASPDDHAALTARLATAMARNTELQRENERIKAQVLTLQEQLHLAIAINAS
jgi:hypothetical protein